MDVEMGHARFAFAFLSSQLGQSWRWNLTCRRGRLAHLSKFSADVISSLWVFLAGFFSLSGAPHNSCLLVVNSV